MERFNTNTAIVITGGFHTEGITDLFRIKDISHMVISPRMIMADHKQRYVSLMLEEKNPLEKILFFKGTKLALPVGLAVKGINRSQREWILLKANIRYLGALYYKFTGKIGVYELTKAIRAINLNIIKIYKRAGIPVSLRLNGTNRALKKLIENFKSVNGTTIMPVEIDYFNEETNEYYKYNAVLNIATGNVARTGERKEIIEMGTLKLEDKEIQMWLTLFSSDIESEERVPGRKTIAERIFPKTVAGIREQARMQEKREELIEGIKSIFDEVRRLGPFDKPNLLKKLRDAFFKKIDNAGGVLSKKEIARYVKEFNSHYNKAEAMLNRARKEMANFMSRIGRFIGEAIFSLRQLLSPGNIGKFITAFLTLYPANALASTLDGYSGDMIQFLASVVIIGVFSILVFLMFSINTWTADGFVNKVKNFLKKGLEEFLQLPRYFVLDISLLGFAVYYAKIFLLEGYTLGELTVIGWAGLAYMLIGIITIAIYIIGNLYDEQPAKLSSVKKTDRDMNKLEKKLEKEVKNMLKRHMEEVRRVNSAWDLRVIDKRHIKELKILYNEIKQYESDPIKFKEGLVRFGFSDTMISEELLGISKLEGEGGLIWVRKPSYLRYALIPIIQRPIESWMAGKNIPAWINRVFFQPLAIEQAAGWGVSIGLLSLMGAGLNVPYAKSVFTLVWLMIFALHFADYIRDYIGSVLGKGDMPSLPPIWLYLTAAGLVIENVLFFTLLDSKILGFILAGAVHVFWNGIIYLRGELPEKELTIDGITEEKSRTLVKELLKNRVIYENFIAGLPSDGSIDKKTEDAEWLINNYPKFVLLHVLYNEKNEKTLIKLKYDGLIKLVAEDISKYEINLKRGLVLDLDVLDSKSENAMKMVEFFKETVNNYNENTQMKVVPYIVSINEDANIKRILKNTGIGIKEDNIITKKRLELQSKESYGDALLEILAQNNIHSVTLISTPENENKLWEVLNKKISCLVAVVAKQSINREGATADLFREVMAIITSGVIPVNAKLEDKKRYIIDVCKKKGYSKYAVDTVINQVFDKDGNIRLDRLKVSENVTHELQTQKKHEESL